MEENLNKKKNIDLSHEFDDVQRQQSQYPARPSVYSKKRKKLYIQIGIIIVSFILTFVLVINILATNSRNKKGAMTSEELQRSFEEYIKKQEYNN